MLSVSICRAKAAEATAAKLEEAVRRLEEELTKVKAAQEARTSLPPA